MRRQVPDDVHVVLEHAEIDPHAIDKVQIANIAGIKDLFDFLNGPAVDVGVVDHENAADIFRRLDELFRIADRSGQRLFYQHVLAGV